MFRFYALRLNFYSIFEKHKDLLLDIETLSVSQLNSIVYSFHINDLYDSANLYFNDEVTCVNNEVYIQNVIQDNFSSLRIYDYYIELDIEGNPFLELLKRKYRWFILVKK